MVAALLGCDEDKDDPCPQIKAGGGTITPVVTTGAAPTASGGTLVAGTYNLTKLDVVVSASASAEGRLKCESLSAQTQQDTLRITPTSATEGGIVSLSVGDDGNGTTTEHRTQGSYVAAGSALSITVSGNACETMLVPQADGGIATIRTVENEESAPLSRPYSSSDSTISFYAAVELAGAVDCVVVQTYVKQ